jgi:hypothetical protein
LLRKRADIGDHCFAPVLASAFAAKNSSPNCFLNAAHLLKVQVLFYNKKQNKTGWVQLNYSYIDSDESVILCLAAQLYFAARPQS